MTDTVTNAANITSLAIKNSGLVAITLLLALGVCTLELTFVAFNIKLGLVE